MAARRATVTAVSALRTCTRYNAAPVARSVRQSMAPSTAPNRFPVQQVSASIRWHSSSGSISKVYSFDDVKNLSGSPSSDRILIDVREPAEYEAGYIPSAINIPVSSQPDALFLPEEEFEDRFGFEKPSKDKELVFYCKAGVRSSAAAQLAQRQGYQKIGEYRGSWLDWQRNGGKTEK